MSITHQRSFLVVGVRSVHCSPEGSSLNGVRQVNEQALASSLEPGVPSPGPGMTALAVGALSKLEVSHQGDYTERRPM